MNNEVEMKAVKIWFDADNLYVVLDSGHTIGNPLAWFPRLLNATSEQRLDFEIGPCGDSLHWEGLDEDLSLESLFDFRRELNYARI